MLHRGKVEGYQHGNISNQVVQSQLPLPVGSFVSDVFDVPHNFVRHPVICHQYWFSLQCHSLALPMYPFVARGSEPMLLMQYSCKLHALLCALRTLGGTSKACRTAASCLPLHVTRRLMLMLGLHSNDSDHSEPEFAIRELYLWECGTRAK
eukprot:2122667-Amphidinium_carterae.1